MSKLYPPLTVSESAPEVRKLDLSEKPSSPVSRVSMGHRKMRSPTPPPVYINTTHLASSGSYGIDLESDGEEISLEESNDGIPKPTHRSSTTTAISSEVPPTWSWIKSELLIIPVVLAWIVLLGAVGDFIFTSAMFEDDYVWVTVIIYPIVTILWCICQAMASYRAGKALKIIMWLSVVHVFLSAAWLVIALLWQYWFSFAAAILAVILDICYILLAARRISLNQQVAENRRFCF